MKEQASSVIKSPWRYRRYLGAQLQWCTGCWTAQVAEQLSTTIYFLNWVLSATGLSEHW